MKKTADMNILNGNALKIIAAAAMLIDHIGYMFFPQVEILRIIGRIAFPVFACSGMPDGVFDCRKQPVYECSCHVFDCNCCDLYNG